jgi:ABC-type multidrug transport system ATPase subunit
MRVFQTPGSRPQTLRARLSYDRPVSVHTATTSDGAAVPVFAARGLTKVYEVGEVTVHALRGIDFDVFPGELVVLVGPSGSGKSTLLNILGGLDVPTAGRVIYKDRDLTAAGESTLTAYRRTHVGFVFQFYNLIPSLTARENVALVTEIVERSQMACFIKYVERRTQRSDDPKKNLSSLNRVPLCIVLRIYFKGPPRSHERLCSRYSTAPLRTFS